MPKVQVPMTKECPRPIPNDPCSHDGARCAWDLVIEASVILWSLEPGNWSFSGAHLLVDQLHQSFEQIEVIGPGDRLDSPAQLAFAFQNLDEVLDAELR